MAQPSPSRPPTRWQRLWRRSFAQLHIALYHLSDGHIGHSLGKVRALLLTTVGRKTGQPRVTPITYLADGPDYVLVASNYGAGTDPLWWRNLQQHPEATVELPGKRIHVYASLANDEERARLSPLLNAYNPTFALYQRNTTRMIPVVILRPIE